MADEADDAKNLEEFALKMSLKAMQNTPKLAPKGECFACEAELDDGVNAAGEPVYKRLFCNLDCSKDYDRMQNRR